MDAAYFREKAETCSRLAKGLSWNNPARSKLIELANDFERQAQELEAAAPRRRHGDHRDQSEIQGSGRPKAGAFCMACAALAPECSTQIATPQAGGNASAPQKPGLLHAAGVPTAGIL
jgi:hypothetical protein